MNYTEWMQSMPNVNRRYIDDAAPEDWAKYDAEFEKWCFEGRDVDTYPYIKWEPTRKLVNSIHYELDSVKTDLLTTKKLVDGTIQELNSVKTDLSILQWDIDRLRKGLKFSAISNILLAVAFILHVVSHWI